MRANEFIIEGLGDWMQGQVIGRRLKNKAAALKQNAPKIAKLLAQNYASEAKQLGKNEAKIEKMVHDSIKKDLRVDPTIPELKDDVAALISAILTNPRDITTTASILQDIVVNAVKADQTYSATDEARVAKLKKAIKEKEMDPSQARTYIIKKLGESGYKESNPKDKDYIEMIIDKVLDDGADDDGADDKGAGEKATVEPNTKSVDDIIASTKEAILSNRKFDTTNKEVDSNNASKEIRRLFNLDGLTIDHKRYDEAVDSVQGDPRMPWNGGFRAMVVVPNDHQDTKIFYVGLRSQDIGLWKLVPPNKMQFIEPVSDPMKIAAIKKLLNAGEAGRLTMDFAKVDKGLYTATKVEE